MAIEVLDKGSCKAAGFIVTAPLPVVVRTQGIARINGIGAGQLTVDLIEPIGADELLCLGTPSSTLGAPAATPTVVFFQPDPVGAPQTIQIETYSQFAASDPGLVEMGIWFAFFRLPGGTPQIIPPPLPP